MIRIHIGNTEREIDTADPNWINQQINGARRDGQSVCVRVVVKLDQVDLVLSTPGCSVGGGGGRALTGREQDIVERWNRLHLNSENFTAGNLIAFLKQIA
jgi:hypothetical protein